MDSAAIIAVGKTILTIAVLEKNVPSASVAKSRRYLKRTPAGVLRFLQTACESV